MNACLRPLLFATLLAATGLRAETFEVTRGDDPAPDGCLVGDCSLREALEAAQATPAADIVRLGEGQYFVTRGDLGVFGSIVVEGAGSAETGVVASGTPAAWRIAAQSDFVLRGVRFVANSGTAIALAPSSISPFETAYPSRRSASKFLRSTSASMMVVPVRRSSGLESSTGQSFSG